MNATQSRPQTSSLSETSFRKFADFITRELGIKMPEGKGQMLQGRLQRRMRALEIDTVEAYQRHLFESPDGQSELVHFIDAVTTNKTDFFREPRHFEYLVRTALPALDRAPSQPWRLKLLCAGCSSGEEPYTLAIALSEYARSARQGFDFTILGTDISTRVLDTAKKAIYEETKIDPVPMDLRKRYLLRSRDSTTRLVRIAPPLRQRVDFRRLNFMDSDYRLKETFDVIFFRNVMIYFDKPTQEGVINKLCRNLRPGGFLFVGHSESLAGLDIPARAVSSAVYQKT